MTTSTVHAAKVMSWLEELLQTRWPNLKVNQLGKYTFQYNLIRLGKYIRFGNKEKILHQILRKTT